MAISTNKDLFRHICEQMEKLAAKKISVDEAKGQAALAKQANNLLRYELDRVKTEMKVVEFNKLNKDGTLYVRDIEEIIEAESV
jgi:hypothetical protein